MDNVEQKQTTEAPVSVKTPRGITFREQLLIGLQDDEWDLLEYSTE